MFNVDETYLFRKLMQKRSFIIINEIQFSGYKAVKGRLTLLVGGNASGNFKLKHIMIYLSENSRALKGYPKMFLSVNWTSNKKTWVTSYVFENWSKVCPVVKEYCSENNLENRVLLLLGNAPGHANTLNEVDYHVKVFFTSKYNVHTAVYGVIANFKAYYLRRTFAEANKKFLVITLQLPQSSWRITNFYY